MNHDEEMVPGTGCCWLLFALLFLWVVSLHKRPQSAPPVQISIRQLHLHFRGGRVVDHCSRPFDLLIPGISAKTDHGLVGLCGCHLNRRSFLRVTIFPLRSRVEERTDVQEIFESVIFGSSTIVHLKLCDGRMRLCGSVALRNQVTQ